MFPLREQLIYTTTSWCYFVRFYSTFVYNFCIMLSVKCYKFVILSFAVGLLALPKVNCRHNKPALGSVKVLDLDDHHVT